MTLFELQKRCEQLLAVDNAAFEAKQLVMFACGVRASDWLKRRSDTVCAEQCERCEQFCHRRNEGEALYYIIGECEFYSLPFKVGKGVLIPRADTETLVDVALDIISDITNPKVVDLCSGSGCVAIAIAAARPDAAVTAVELHQPAFSYLESNIALNQTDNVTAVCADALRYSGSFDLVVSNPPYIAEKERETLQIEVLNEPHTALFAPQNGYLFYQKISENFKNCKDTAVAFEVGCKMDSKTVKIMEQNGYTDIRTTRDLCGINRVVMGRAPK